MNETYAFLSCRALDVANDAELGIQKLERYLELLGLAQHAEPLTDVRLTLKAITAAVTDAIGPVEH